ncbi:hypothetical protein [Desulfobacter latus]|uniref:Uncharacterized protein n=1 Tax=Desulfobacter latus TaxID=2292 RepID=A0A850TDA3_9BACT|nr:hypothetical protein [Desulfobacter latus]NWH06257.1 hypothetical protein [Desulfobacter latus]
MIISVFQADETIDFPCLSIYFFQVSKIIIQGTWKNDLKQLFDLDYEQFPDQHGKKTEEILKENDWPQDLIRAVVSHGWVS